jgi:signal transduction histidine kinase
MQPTAEPTRDAVFRRLEHDLRGELATMLAGVHFVLRYVPAVGDDGRRMLDRVRSAGERLTRLLDELGHAAWATGADPRWLALERCELGAVVAGAVAASSARAAAREVTVDVAPIAEHPIDADPELLREALAYVVEAAVLRTRAGGRVVVAVRATPDEHLEVLVRDEGGPVPADMLARAFEPFVSRELAQREGPRSRDTLGLGLAIARGVLRAHGGDARATAWDGGLAITATL